MTNPMTESTVERLERMLAEARAEAETEAKEAAERHAMRCHICGREPYPYDADPPTYEREDGTRYCVSCLVEHPPEWLPESSLSVLRRIL